MCRRGLLLRRGEIDAIFPAREIGIGDVFAGDKAFVGNRMAVAVGQLKIRYTFGQTGRCTVFVEERQISRILSRL